jgi:hypothetical protein
MGRQARPTGKLSDRTGLQFIGLLGLTRPRAWSVREM